MGWQALMLVLILCCCASAQNQAVHPTTAAAPPESLEVAAMDGFNLTDAEARAIESKLKANPDDARSRARLLVYYLRHATDQRAARRDHVLWMIRNRPSDHFTGSPFCQIEPSIDPDGYKAARELWMGQVESPSTPSPALGNAAKFLTWNDPKAAENLLTRAEVEDPNNPQWPKDLADVYSVPLAATQPSERAGRARLALAQYEKAVALSTDRNGKFYCLTDLPEAALAAGENAKAADYANQVLARAKAFKGDWNYGNAVHKANLILGRVALASGDVETAKARLLDAGRTPGSPQLDSFGPNMELARELLRKGEKQVVLEYFDLCGRFWKSGADKLDSWKKTIQSGGTPDFGANLDY